jgi:hypothetical protein
MIKLTFVIKSDKKATIILVAVAVLAAELVAVGRIAAAP